MACRGSGLRIPVLPLENPFRKCKSSGHVSHLAPGRVSHSSARFRYRCRGGSGTCVPHFPPSRHAVSRVLDVRPVCEKRAMLIELSMVEQRYQAVREVLESGLSITQVAAQYGVDRRKLHR
jgi:hypothetical protein